MYSHLSAAAAAERTEDHLYQAHLRRVALRATTVSSLETVPSTAEIVLHGPGRTSRLPWRRRIRRSQPRTA